MPGDRERPVYETGKGRLCTECGQVLDRCACQVTAEPVPARVRCTLRLEKKGRRGKTVTVVSGLPQNPTFLSLLAGELKRGCGSGGTAGEGSVEIQGDHRARLRQLLEAKGYLVRG